MTLPNLAGVATAELVEKIGTGKFSAAYINWSRTLNLLREHAPGWLPESVMAPDGGMLHRAPVGAYLLLRFRNGDQVTPEVPQAVMDHRNAAIPFDSITARDITDTHRRGVCLAAAMTFGLAYELWAKVQLESGYREEEVRVDPREAELNEISLWMIDEHQAGRDAKVIDAWYSPATWSADGPTATEEQKYVWGQLREFPALRRVIKANKQATDATVKVSEFTGP